MLYQASADLRAVVSPSLLATGCVNVVGLDALKNYLGTNWPQFRENVYARLEALFRAKLGPTDFFLRLDDTSYLVAMPSSDPEDVDVVCLRISYDLYMTTIGRCDLGHIQISSLSIGDADSINFELMPFERIIELADKAGIRSFNMPGDASPPETGTIDFPADAPQPVEAGRGLYVEHHFLPVWSAVNSAVTTYICAVKAAYMGAAREPVPYVLLTPKERVQAKVSCLNAGIAQLKKKTQAADRFLLGIAVSFEVLASPTARMEFLSACRELPGDFRPYLNFVLTDVPLGVVQTRLTNMVNMLRPFSRSVDATVAPTTRVYSAYQGIGLRAIGFDLRAFTNTNILRQQDADQLVRNARYANLGTFLSSVSSIPVLDVAQAAGIQQICGSAVAPPCDEPSGMWRLTWDDLAARRQAS